MFRVKFVLTTALGVCALFVSAAVAAPVSNNQPEPNGGSVFHTVLQPDLTLKTTLSLSVAPEAAVGPKHGFCRCSCGFACETSADCGGASCDPFITCCVRGEPGQTPFFEFGKSTRNGEESLPAVKCK
jgi:hypothetical protein